ncbi:MAG TPA: SRPBCC family protein [Actinomycetota bacterium]|jgi:uncharacterized protein YndB with AHSA1/START domain
MTVEPIRADVTVNRAPEDAFRVFTRDLGTWWPVEHYSMAHDRDEDGVKVESVVFEEREGGRVYEVMSDGAEGVWGTVLAWDPPRRLVLSWKPNLRDAPPTEIEVVFTPDGGGTRVDLEHRGWERLGALAMQAREGYGAGWTTVLGRFAAAAQAKEG